jgi:hypothetical protein
MCQAMEFRHLPMPGGLFAQNPGLLDAFRYIWGAQAAEDRKKKAKEKNARMGPVPKNAGNPPR